jgi:pimeloyl-ACP methyl ester carboxylesterase
MTSADGGFRHRQVDVGSTSIHVVEAGDPEGAPVVLLHGWPESWRCWKPVMELARPRAWVMAMDLPGVAGSTGGATDGSKRALARMVHDVVGAMELGSFTVVGHDVGGMVAYAYLRSFDDLLGCVIMDVVLPGLEPWDDVLRNPYLWHFAFHAVPGLPERLVQGHQGEYFDYFYNALSADPGSITAEARSAYVEAYSSEEALRAGFDWYRAFGRDAADNRDSRAPGDIPVLYVRGEHETGKIGDYVAGLRHAGLTEVQQALVMGSGHFAPEEGPQETWEVIATFMQVQRRG